MAKAELVKIVENADVAAVALASLTKLVNLLGAELVVGRRWENIDLFENCVRATLFASVAGVSPDATASGVALAHRLVEPVLRDLRARAEQAPEWRKLELAGARRGSLN